MKAGSRLVVLIGWLVIWFPGGDLAIAQGQEEKPETEASASGEGEPAGEGLTEEERKAEEKEAELRRALLEQAAILTETVKVTATRVETDLMKTPVAVTVIDQEQLNRQGVEDVRDLAQMVPNMDIATVNGQGTPIISLRGIRSTNTTELGDPSVGVHLDGIYSPRMQGALGLLFDNERIEVLRGPQGTLFGRNSTVGTINIVPAKPQLSRFASDIQATVGNYDALDLQGMVNVPVSDTWAFRFSGRYLERDSYLDGYYDPNQYDQRRFDPPLDTKQIGTGAECLSEDCFTQTQNNNFWAAAQDIGIFALQPANENDFYLNAKEWAYRASAYWEPKRGDMTLNLSYQHFRKDDAGGVDLVNCDKLDGRPLYSNVFATGPDGEQILDDLGRPILIGLVQNGTNDCSDLFPENDTYQAVVNTPGRLYLDIKYFRSSFNWDMKDNLRLVVLAGGETQDRESDVDMEQSLNAFDQSFHFLPGTGSKSWSPEIQLQSFENPHLNWIVGANYFHETTETFGYFDNTITEKSMFDQPDRSTDAYALFAQGTYSFNPKWHLTLGYRYSDETKEDKGGRTLVCNPDAPENECAPTTPAGDPLIWGEVSPGLRGWDREQLNNDLPADFWEDPANYETGGKVQLNDLKRSWSHNDFRVGLDWQRNERELYYGYVATGFKSGGIGDVFSGTLVSGARNADASPIGPCPQQDFDDNPDGEVGSGICDPRYIDQSIGELQPNTLPTSEAITIETDFDEEEVTTLELGFKLGLLDNKVQLRGAWFSSLYEDLQYAYVSALAYTEDWAFYTDSGGFVDTDGDGVIPDFDWFGRPAITGFITENVPEVTLHGFELEYDTRPWPGGHIFGYVSWIDSEITEDYITKWDYDPVSYLNLTFDEANNPQNEVLTVNLKGNEMAVAPPWKLHMTIDHAFLFERQKLSIVPWLTAHWEDDAYLTIWNVDKHLDDMDFVILDEDIRYTDDRRDAWSMFHAGVRLYHGNLMAEIFGYNLTDEVVQWWGGAAEQVAKGSFSMPRTYGMRVAYKW